MKKPILLIIAGPQSSGKTTIWKLLKKHYRSATFIDETNQYTVQDKKHLGAAYVDKDLEAKIIRADIKKITGINKPVKLVIIETSIFHSLYSEALGDEKKAHVFYSEYLRSFRRFKPKVLFIDTKPLISWKRRKKYYLGRIKKAGINDRQQKSEMLKKYKNKIFQLYPFWIKYYQALPFPKIRVKNSSKPYKKFIAEVLNRLDKIPTIPQQNETL